MDHWFFLALTAYLILIFIKKQSKKIVLLVEFKMNYSLKSLSYSSVYFLPLGLKNPFNILYSFFRGYNILLNPRNLFNNLYLLFFLFNFSLDLRNHFIDPFSFIIIHLLFYIYYLILILENLFLNLYPFIITYILFGVLSIIQFRKFYYFCIVFYKDLLIIC